MYEVYSSLSDTQAANFLIFHHYNVKPAACQKVTAHLLSKGYRLPVPPTLSLFLLPCLEIGCNLYISLKLLKIFGSSIHVIVSM